MDDEPFEGTLGEAEWLAREFDALTVHLEVLTPSAWAEKKRYLPPSLTSLPGFYRFSITPYLREIVDNLGVDSPVRETSLMKGAQIGGTVGVSENVIGYFLEHVKTAPIMFVTADAELAKQRLDVNIVPMIQHSGLTHLIKSGDEGNRRKTGQTATRIEWHGGGFLIPFGAKSSNKLRSTSIQILLRDEIDGWPDVVGKDGDPLQLSLSRTSAFEASRKILDISTPTIKGVSKIERRYALGDQRKFFVPCLGCGHAQVLRWRHTDPNTGEVTGITWDVEDGRLVPGSVRYRCVECGHPHTNDDKIHLLAAGEWRPTALADPRHRSYHISALYSPPGMQSWEACVQQWIEAWDEERSQPKNLQLLQVFYNNVLGEPFRRYGERVRFEVVSAHRRSYHMGELPNRFAIAHCGSPILLLTCAVDVHKAELPAAVIGWCRDGRAVLVDYWRWKGDTEQLDDPNTWGQLRTLMESTEYVADDGQRYRVQLTLIDAGYQADIVYRFAADYVAGVNPIMGRGTDIKTSLPKLFTSFTTPMGTVGYTISVNLYKDRWSAALRRGWSGQDIQPAGLFNAPIDTTDDQLRELTKEVKREKLEAKTGRRLGFEWHRPSGAANELWDLLIYNSAALDIVAWDVCRNQLGLESVSWPDFYELLHTRKLFIEG